MANYDYHIKVTPWMRGVVTRPVNRGRIVLRPGFRCLAHYVPAKYDKDGNLVRCEGWEIYNGHIHNTRKGEYPKYRFLFLDELNVKDMDGNIYKGRKYSTSSSSEDDYYEFGA